MVDLTSLNKVSLDFLNNSLEKSGVNNKTNEDAFSSLLNSAMGMVNETNSLSNAAESEKIKFAMGESENTHDLTIAQQKASVSLQYTVAVKNKILEAYKELMNMQI